MKNWNSLRKGIAGKSLLACGALMAVFAVSACENTPPRAECLAGDYTLNKSKSVQLILGSNHFRLTAGVETVTGHYQYNSKPDVGDMPGTGNVTLDSESGKISAPIQSAIFQEAGKNEDVLSFFDSMQEGRGRSWPVYNGGDDTINIVLDSDLDSILLQFSKSGCHATNKDG
jgi:hypothetical protein